MHSATGVHARNCTCEESESPKVHPKREFGYSGYPAFATFEAQCVLNFDSGESMTDEEQKRAIRRFNAAVENRALEINLFWQRSLFFWGFIAASFLALANVYGEHDRLAIAVSCFGLTCSFCWALANRGSRHWHEHWERAVQELENDAVGELFALEFPTEPKGWLSARRYSVGKIAIALSDYAVILWLVLLAYQLVSMLSQGPQLSALGLLATLGWVLFTLGFLLYLRHKAQSKSLTEKPADNEH